MVFNDVSVPFIAKAKLLFSQDIRTSAALSESLIANCNAIVKAVYESAIEGLVATGITEDEASALAVDGNIMLIEQYAYVKVESVSSWCLD